MDIKNNKVTAKPSMSDGSVAHVAADTLIVWTETNGTDMALSFQEAEGCAVIW
jgi:protein phosphatase 4 regulatory subunit 3